SSSATTTDSVGSYAIYGSGLTVTNNNYAAVIVQAAGNATALTINPATLTYVATSASRNYGAANPSFSGTVSGFVNTDNQPNSTPRTLSFSSSATATDNVGSYAINGSGLTVTNSNYATMIVQAAGNATALSITPATLTYTANTASRVYGATDP